MTARTHAQVATRIGYLISHYPDTPGLRASCDRVLGLITDGLPGPYLYPSEDGLSAEWDVGDWSISLEFLADTIEGDATNTTTGDSARFVFPPDSDRATLTAAVQSMFDTARAKS